MERAVAWRWAGTKSKSSACLSKKYGEQFINDGRTSLWREQEPGVEPGPNPKALGAYISKKRESLDMLFLARLLGLSLLRVLDGILKYLPPVYSVRGHAFLVRFVATSPSQSASTIFHIAFKSVSAWVGSSSRAELTFTIFQRNAQGTSFR